MARYSKYVSCAVCPEKFHFKDGFMKDGRRASQDPDMVEVMEMAANGGIVGSFAKAGIKSLGGIPPLYCSIRCVQSIHGGGGSSVQPVQQTLVKEVIKEVVVKLDPIVEKTKELQEKENPTTAKELKSDFTAVQALFGLSDPTGDIDKAEGQKLEYNKAIILKLKSYLDLWTLEYSSEEDFDKVAFLIESKVKDFENQLEQYYSVHKEIHNKEMKYAYAGFVVLGLMAIWLVFEVFI